MRKKAVLFDFDGTIAASIHVGVAIFNELAREYGFSEITPEKIPALREKGARHAARELNIPRLKIPTIVRRLRKELKARIGTVVPVAGMKQILITLKKNGCELGIVTSNSKTNVRAFLRNNKLEIFDYIRTGSGVFNKAAAIRKTVVRHDLNDHEKIFVGDEIRDVVAARKNKMTVVAVTWGANSRKGLEKENADFIVDTADELSAILSDFCEMN
jgi:phosphoglycolate phosphatase